MENGKLLDLTKTLELNLTKNNWSSVPKMEVKLAVDKSGSMDDEFRCGWVQNTIDLFIAAALKFDDNGKLEIGFFNTSFKQTPDATAADIETYVRKHGINAGGGTNFADAIATFKGSKVSGGFFGFGKKETKPTYIGLITDGDNSDKREFEKQLDSLENTYVQIIAIGTGVDKKYLNYIADKYDTVEVMYLPNPRSLSVDEFYGKMLNEEFKQFAFKK
jgi:uncharacterized protein with von Willebrand factor type A (vWA) domain